MQLVDSEPAKAEWADSDLAPVQAGGTQGCRPARSGSLGPPAPASTLEAPALEQDEAASSLFANSFPHQAPSVPNGDP